MFRPRNRGESEILWVKPENETFEAKQDRLEKYIPIDIRHVGLSVKTVCYL